MIPIPVAQFVIGRDETCQLRPSSPAVSKKHCGLFVKGGRVFVRDMGSTNGTFVNDTQITGETEVNDGDRLKVGPLAFVVRMEKPAASTTTPVPPKAAAKPADTPRPAAPKTEEADDPDRLAAMLLATDDGPTGPLTDSSIPEGTTVFEMPAVGTDPNAPKKPDAKPAAPTASTSDAADAILRKYMRRPRT